LAALLVACLAFPSIAQRQQQSGKRVPVADPNVEPAKKKTGSAVPPYNAKGESTSPPASGRGGKSAQKNYDGVDNFLKH
jgi:hypothetical protein